MKEITLEEFIDWVVDDVCGDSDSKAKLTLLHDIEYRPTEAEKIIFGQFNTWVASAKEQTGKEICLKNNKETSLKIMYRLKEVLKRQLAA
jgi:hypothetical protein